MTTGQILLLASAAAGAGFVNAVAGGGTLLTFPALLAAGVSPLIANATSTFALCIGMLGGVHGFRSHLGEVRGWLWKFIPVSLVGGGLGAWLLTRTDEKFFESLVPFLILFATVVFMAQGPIRRFAGFGAGGPAHPHHRSVWVAVFFQFWVAVYGGYFGAGIGILMLASLCFLGLEDIREINTLKTVLAFCINLLASCLLAAKGLVDWPCAAVMIAGSFAGYQLGAHFTRRIDPTRVRATITVIGLTLTAVYFWRRYR